VGAKLTARQMRAHSNMCPKRTAGSDHVDRRGRNSKARPREAEGELESSAWTATGAADALRLGLRADLPGR